MRPICIRFKCFGPYVQEQSIDLTLLEPSGLFLICGETGSGKTTILDAMCYALYGKSSGGLRGDMSVMRCKQAAPGDETFVEFIFESDGKRYRFFRSIKPRKKRKTTEEKKKGPTQSEFNTTYECQMLADGTFIPLPDAKDKASFLNDKAVEIIGLTYDQFRQVIILPQGQFEELLVSNSDEKEEILVTLFHADRWHRIAEKLHQLAKDENDKLDREKLLIAEKLKSYGCQTTSELAQKAADGMLTLQRLEQELKDGAQLVAQRKQAYEAALLDDRDFQQRDKLKKTLDALLPKVDENRLEEMALERADRADTITPVYHGYQTALAQKRLAENALSDAGTALTGAVSALDSASSEQQAHEAGRADYAANKQRIFLLETSRELYRSLNEKKTAAQDAQKSLKKAEAQAKEQVEAFAEADDAWVQAIAEQRKAVDAQRVAQDLYLKGIGSTLAQRLVAGERCPVCGSLEHPAPAQPTEDHVTDAQLDKLTKAVNQANKQEQAARQTRMDAEKKNSELQTALSAIQQAAAVAQAEYDQACQQRVDGIETEQQLDAQMKKLNTAVTGYEQAETTIQDKVNTAKSGLQTAQNALTAAESALQEANQELHARKLQWENTRDAANFDSDSQYSAACIPPAEKLTRRTALIQFNTDLSNAQRAYHDQRTVLEGRQQPDVAGAKAGLDDAQTKWDAIKSTVIIAQQKQQAMDADVAELTTRMEIYDKKHIAAEESMMFARRLRGDFGVSLQRYVLGVMLTSITTAANQLLKTVYAGRYQLFRTNEATGAKRKRGLELEVYDANNNERRSVTTLSGGEKFLVALSLAIGLSTVVQAQGKGVRLEAMFIDEGFGSLDRESVNDALEVLQGIRRSGLVGIISHVDQLAETIPAKIQTTKAKNGSKCEIRC